MYLSITNQSHRKANYGTAASGRIQRGFKMKMKVERERIVILPENDQDIAYIEDMLGLKEAGETVPCKRAAMIGLSRSITYLEIKK